MRGTEKRRSPLLFLSLLLFLSPSSLIAMDAEEAWSVATVLMKEAEAWKAGAMSMIMVEYGKDGMEKSREESQYRIRYSEEGKMESELLRAVKNGEDITEKKRKEAASGKGWGRPGQGKDGGGMGFPQPFSPPKGDVMERGPARLGVHSARAVWIFPFTYKVKGGLGLKGEVFLDKENGRPVALSVSVAGGFPGLEAMSMRGRYADEGQGGLLATAEMRMSGQFLFKRVDYSFTMAFSEYQLAGAAEKGEAVAGGATTH